MNSCLQEHKSELTAQSELDINRPVADKRFCREWWQFKKALYPRLGTAALRIFLVLEDRASRWNNYEVPMSLSTLGEETGVKHHTTLASGIRELEAAGIIAVNRQPGNARSANSYRLLIAELLGDKPPTSQRKPANSCDCAAGCQLVANEKTPTSGTNNNGTGAGVSNPPASNPGDPAAHAVLAAPPGRGDSMATSAKTEPHKVSRVNSGSAKTDSVLTCFKTINNSTNREINWFNPDGLNGVTAVKIPPVKANNNIAEQPPEPEEHEHAEQPPKLEAKSYLANQNQPQKYQQQHQQPHDPAEYFKRLSWATNARERMAVLFAALRQVIGQEPGKADFSMVQALVNEYGCKAVLRGLLALAGREVAHPNIFAYLRGVIRRQTAAEPGHGGGSNSPATRYYSASVSSRTQQPARRLPIDLAKYTGTGKYAHLVASS